MGRVPTASVTTVFGAYEPDRPFRSAEATPETPVLTPSGPRSKNWDLESWRRPRGSTTRAERDLFRVSRCLRSTSRSFLHLYLWLPVPNGDPRRRGSSGVEFPRRGVRVKSVARSRSRWRTQVLEARTGEGVLESAHDRGGCRSRTGTRGSRDGTRFRPVAMPLPHRSRVPPLSTQKAESVSLSGPECRFSGPFSTYVCRPLSETWARVGRR